MIAPAAEESLVRRDRKGKAVGRAALPTQLRFKLLLAAVLALLSVGAVVSSVRVALIAQPLKLSQDACPAVPDGNGLLDGIVYICTGKGWRGTECTTDYEGRTRTQEARSRWHHDRVLALRKEWTNNVPHATG